MISPGTHFSLRVEPEFTGWRLDLWLSHCLRKQVSRSLIQRWIHEKHVSSPNEKQLSSRRRVRPEEIYEITVPHHETPRLKAVDLGIQIIYEDADLIVIHKLPGTAVHPGPNQSDPDSPTIAHGLLHLWKKQGLWLNLPKEYLRPGIVHRLDRDTEGLLVAAKHELAQRRLMALFARRQVHKEYLAWLWGSLPSDKDRMELAIARHPVWRLKMQVNTEGRIAVTAYNTLKVINTPKGRKFSQVELYPLTGRTHQLRVHTAYHKAPVVGDPLYSHNTLNRFGLLLFARRLVFTQPLSGKKLDLSLSLPERFIEFERACARF